MIPNHSPWIKQLKRTRPVVPIGENITTDVVIVGGGIAGVVTAYFTLRDTNKNVVLLEAGKIAHGATGHNAGQITSYFERPLSELVEEFGLTLAIEGQRAIESGWALLEEIMNEAGLRTPFHRFTGFAAVSKIEQLILHLKNNSCRMRGGLKTESILVAKELGTEKEIPRKYESLYSTITYKDLLSLLETNNSEYIASVSYEKGCINSALFTEELIGYLITTYKNRFVFFEGSPVKRVLLKNNSAILEVLEHTVHTEHVVLCTNGFENFHIINEAGAEIDTTFHHMVEGRIGYMAGYIEPMNNPPTAISYFQKRIEKRDDTLLEYYYYLTRRPHEHEAKGSYNLISVGGPEKILPNHAIYSQEDPSSIESRNLIDEFLRKNYRHHPNADVNYEFSWHGLMGYTPNGIRRIGPEPCNPTLLYNLGCNGVGILPSLYGGKRIAEFLQGKEMSPSIFDPHDQRRTLK